MIKFSCDNCNGKIEVSSEFADQKVECPKCGHEMVAPPVNDIVSGKSQLDNPQEDCSDSPQFQPIESSGNTAEDSFQPLSEIGKATPANFIKAIIFSSVGAAIGALVWAFIAVKIGYEVGYVAWGVGLLAGLGAVMSRFQPGIKLGVTAALIAICGIFAGKAVTVVWDFSSSKHELAGQYAQESIDDGEMFLDTTLSYLEMEGKLTEEEISIFYGLIEDEQKTEALVAKAFEVAKSWSDEDKKDNFTKVYVKRFDDNSTEIVKAGFMESFQGMDLIFIGLALMTAFKMGAGAVRK